LRITHPSEEKIGRGKDFSGKAEEKISRRDEKIGKAEEKISRAEDFLGLFFLPSGKAEDFSGLGKESFGRAKKFPGQGLECVGHFWSAGTCHRFFPADLSASKARRFQNFQGVAEKPRAQKLSPNRRRQVGWEKAVTSPRTPKVPDTPSHPRGDSQDGGG